MPDLNPIARHLPLLAALALSACGGGGGGGASTGSGTLDVAVTDAPVDGAQQVVVTFTAVTVQPAAGDAIELPLTAPQSIDLLALAGGQTADLLDGENLDAGQYNWIRLELDTDPAATYIIDELGGQHPLTIPSGDQRGLQLNRPFEIVTNGSASFVIDFDLRQSVTLQGDGSYRLRPTLRIVDAIEAGALFGSIDAGLITPDCVPAVYVFAAGQPVDDIDGDDGDPLATAVMDPNGPYDYRVYPLEQGDYLASFTCNADLDSADSDDDAGMSFSTPQPATISEAGETELSFM